MRSLLFITALGLTGCQPPVADSIPGDIPREGELIETVGDAKVTKGMLDLMMSTLPPGAREQIEAQGQIGQLQEQLVTQEVLYQEALSQGLHNKDDVKTLLAFAEREALIEALLRQVAESKTSDEALKTWYEEHKVQFRGDEVKLAQITLGSEADANAVKAEAEAGKDFTALAKEKSVDPTALENGGEIGWLGTRQLSRGMPEELMSGEVGAIIGPWAPPGAPQYMVFKILEKRDMKPFDEVKEQIKPTVQKEAVQAYVKELQDKQSAAGGAATVDPAAPAAPAGEHGADDGHAH